METYEYHESEQFGNKINRLKKKNLSDFKRVRKVIDRLCINPTNYDHPLKGDNKGKFEKWVGRRGHRLVYCWCEICQRLGFQPLNRCDKCGSLPPNSIVFFDTYHKSDLKKAGY